MNNTIYTHDEAARILEMFEDVLNMYNIHIPSPEDDERDNDNIVGLYGSTYSELLDNVEERLIMLLDSAKQGSNITKYEFSGTM